MVRERTLGCASPKGRAAVERRQASAPWPGCALRRKVKQGDPRLSAFGFLFSLFVLFPGYRAPRPIVMASGFPPPETSDEDREGGVVLGNGVPHNSGAKKFASRERERLRDREPTDPREVARSDDRLREAIHGRLAMAGGPVDCLGPSGLAMTIHVAQTKPARLEPDVSSPSPVPRASSARSSSP